MRASDVPPSATNVAAAVADRHAGRGVGRPLDGGAERAERTEQRAGVQHPRAAGIGVGQPLQSRCAAAEQRDRVAATRIAEQQIGDETRRDPRRSAATCWRKHPGSVSQSGLLDSMRLGPPRRPSRVVDLINPAAVLLPAANVIMQLASPAVGYGVLESPVDSGNVYKHPFKRARTTGTYLAAATLGTDADRALIRDEVDRVHALVRSTTSSPVSYNAFDPRLQLWVAACLYRYYVDQHEFLYGPLDDDAADAVYRGRQETGHHAAGSRRHVARRPARVR